MENLWLYVVMNVSWEHGVPCMDVYSLSFHFIYKRLKFGQIVFQNIEWTQNVTSETLLNESLDKPEAFLGIGGMKNWFEIKSNQRSDKIFWFLLHNWNISVIPLVFLHSVFKNTILSKFIKNHIDFFC